MKTVIASLIIAASQFAFAALPTDLEELNQEVMDTTFQVQEIAKDIACEKTADCVAVAVGRRACGGPQSYVITRQERATELEALSSYLISLQTQRTVLTGEFPISICSIELEPEVTCDVPTNSCVAKSRF